VATLRAEHRYRPQILRFDFPQGLHQQLHAPCVRQRRRNIQQDALVLQGVLFGVGAPPATVQRLGVDIKLRVAALERCLLYESIPPGVDMQLAVPLYI